MEPRMKNPALIVPGALEALQNLGTSVHKTGLPATTLYLIEARASQINGCSVCLDMHSRELRAVGESDERVVMVGAWRECPYFSEAERAALALAEAGAAPAHGDVPVGAVAVSGGRVVASRHNERELRGDPTAHAELLALADAAAALGTWRLSGLTLVVTLEPCPMCAGALVASRADRVVFGAADPKAGACGSLYNLCADPRLNHEVEVEPKVLAGRCAELLETFFAARRQSR